MAISRYRDALLNLKRSGSQVHPALPVDITTNTFDILLLPPRAFRTHKPRPEDAYYAVALFLHSRHLNPEVVSGHRGRGSLLLTPRLDAQNLFTRMFADIGNGNLAHPRVLQQTVPLPSQITAAHVAALKPLCYRLCLTLGCTGASSALPFGFPFCIIAYHMLISLAPMSDLPHACYQAATIGPLSHSSTPCVLCGKEDNCVDHWMRHCIVLSLTLTLLIGARALQGIEQIAQQSTE